MLNDPHLSPIAKSIIADSASTFLLSPASYWEIAIKIAAGKYRLNSPYEEFWRKGMQDNSIELLPIKIPHTSRLLSMPFHHKDPFDRLLVAQALVEEIPLISNDATLDAYGIRRVWNLAGHSASF